ncbi:MAG TPA: RNA polymerase sigma factor [Acidimicrobiales bacterium]|nr:RNA polymerase sigma factor [Acidimicrobiales bacterium]
MRTTPTDAEIVAQSRADPDMFAAIFERHVIPIHTYLVRRAGRDTADDLLSEVFRVAFEVRGRFRQDRASALLWLYGIAANVLRQSWRAQHRQNRVTNRLSSLPLQPSDFDNEPEEVLSRNEDVSLAVRALNPLPPADRETLLLYAWEDLTYAETSEVLDIPVGTVRARLSRARSRVREHLAASGEVVGNIQRRTDRGYRS